MKTRGLAEAALVAALYTLITWAVAPLAYGPVQFRLSEALKGLMPYRKHLIGAFVVGNLLSNLLSPQAGVWEWVWMPAVNLVGASLCWWVGQRRPYLGAAIYALCVSAGVATLLHVVLHLPWLLQLAYVLPSELVLIVGGVPLMRLVHLRLEAAR